MHMKSNPSRRTFLKRAAASLAIPYIISSSALGKDGQEAPSNRITIASIGVGGMGTGNMHSFLSKNEAQVLAVCDVDRSHLEDAAKIVNDRYGNNDCATYKDFREVIARDDIDAVSVAVPDQWHSIMAVTAARAGKDIYGEKPLAHSIAEGRAIVDAVERYGVIWQTGSWQRSVANFRTACELVRNGRIGEVKNVTVRLPYGYGTSSNTDVVPVPEGFDYDLWLGPAPWAPYCPGRCHFNFRWISDYAGGQLTDWAGHHVDIAHWGMNCDLSGPVLIKNAKPEWPSGTEVLYDTPYGYHFECEYKEGFSMVVEDCKINTTGVTFHGSEGWVFVDRGRLDANPKSLLQSKIKPGEIHLYNSNDHHQNFLDCVKSRQKTITPAEVAHHSIMVAHLGMAAMKLGRDLQWDNEKEEFIGDAQANRLLSRSMRGPWHL